jgi:hypothetical protein
VEFGQAAFASMGKDKCMNEVMSSVEIETQFKSEWILVGNPETNEALEVKRGEVLWHSKDRDEVYKKVMELKPKHSAILYTGTINGPFLLNY